MSNSANWFAKKLGGSPAPSPAPASQPAPQQAAPAAPQIAQQQQPVDPNNVKPGEPGSLSHALQSADSSGGDGHRTGAVGTCPSCGSGNYFTLRNGASCFDCGYPLVQYSSQMGEGTLQAGDQ